MSRILIVGTGKHAKVVFHMLQQQGVPKAKIIFMDLFKKRFSEYLGCEVIGGLEEKTIHIPPEFLKVIVAYGGTPYQGNFQRQHATNKIMQLMKKEKFKFISVVSKDSKIDRTARVGRNTSIGSFALINSDARVGDGVIVNSGVIVEHDVRISDYSTISPGAIILGSVELGTRVYVGGGAIIRNNVKVGDDVIVGMGAVVTKDIPSKSIAIGNPPRIFERKDLM